MGYLFHLPPSQIRTIQIFLNDLKPEKQAIKVFNPTQNMLILQINRILKENLYWEKLENLLDQNSCRKIGLLNKKHNNVVLNILVPILNYCGWYQIYQTIFPIKLLRYLHFHDMGIQKYLLWVISEETRSFMEKNKLNFEYISKINNLSIDSEFQYKEIFAISSSNLPGLNVVLL